MMKLILNLFICILLLTVCSDELLKPDKEETIYEDSSRSIVVTTYFTKDSIINLPVWVVKEVIENTGEEKTLFTVERIFQESEPGYPELNSKSNNISNSSASYSYSLADKQFVANKIPSRVYTGPYRKPDSR